ncbi:MAG: hypothetical protein JNJ77_15835 [Planctomycetia bacterium]|nr:hypothetical protein [Planctomycetia bacterium]
MLDYCAITGSLRQERESLEEIIRNRLGYSVGDLQVQLSDKGIVLKGNTQSWYTKQLAQELVMQHSSLPIALNAIRVIFPCRN